VIRLPFPHILYSAGVLGFCLASQSPSRAVQPLNLQNGTYVGSLGAFQKGQYLIPNEFHFTDYRPFIKKRSGVLMIVGSFRGLFMAGLGNYTRVIQIDIDPHLAAFNRFNLDFIRNHPRRKSYLIDMGFFERTPQPASPLKEHLKPYTQKSPGIAKRISVELSPEKLKRLREKLRKEGTWNDTYLGSDSLYKKVRRMILENRIQVIQGNLATRFDDWDQWMNAIRQRQMKIATFDVSNAMHAMEPIVFQQLLNNISRYPDLFSNTLLTHSWESDRALMFNKTIRRPHEWVNFVTPVETFQSMAQTALPTHLGIDRFSLNHMTNLWKELLSFGRFHQDGHATLIEHPFCESELR